MFAADNLFGCSQVSVRELDDVDASPSDHHVIGGRQFKGADLTLTG
jgi:hypothetical protein